MMKTLIITGGAGFIGCNFVRRVLAHTSFHVLVVDKLTYAGSPLNLEEVASDPRFQFEQADIADVRAMGELFKKRQPAGIVNFAAETHVDRSIDRPSPFVETNVVGTFVLLDTALRYYQEDPSARAGFRFLHVSTDEVYGTLGATGAFTETTPYAPNSPYSASKAAADHFVRAYKETYGLPALITNCSNNYGPFQFPEKLIPLMILNALEGGMLPVYGDGGNVRDWLYVEDHCEGILRVLEAGKPGEKYNLGGNCEMKNIDVVDKICAVLENLRPAAQNAVLKKKGIAEYQALKTFVKDRPGHDRRYAIDASKIRRELGWEPRHDFDSGLRQTVTWYLEHQDWCEKIQAGTYQRERLGVGRKKEREA